jgi:hypothetical protein
VNQEIDGRPGAADFFDAQKRLRGSATLVTQRVPALSGLTVIDVVGADQDLCEFLARLDRSRLLVQRPTDGGTLFRFRWASGYSNGQDVRIQGLLEAR